MQGYRGTLYAQTRGTKGQIYEGQTSEDDVRRTERLIIEGSGGARDGKEGGRRERTSWRADAQLGRLSQLSCLHSRFAALDPDPRLLPAPVP